jgi:hypothetical protein
VKYNKVDVTKIESRMVVTRDQGEKRGMKDGERLLSGH